VGRRQRFLQDSRRVCRVRRPYGQTGGRATRKERELDDEVIYVAMETVAVQLIAMTLEFWMAIGMIRHQGVDDDLWRDRQREQAQETSGK